jgi:hypothetical protein
LHCKHCDAIIKYVYNTTGMLSHMRSCHPEIYGKMMGVGKVDEDGLKQELLGVKVSSL